MSDNTPVDEDIEFEDYQEMPEFPELSEAAVRDAQKGQFQVTMFESWTQILEHAINLTKEPPLVFVDSVLRQWPWLSYKDTKAYFDTRRSYLTDALNILIELYPKPKEELFEENVDDFIEHRDAYMKVFVEWRKFCDRMADEWQAVPINHGNKPIIHSVVADVTALLINPQNGLLTQLGMLAGFDVTDEELEKLDKEIQGVDDE